MRAAGVSARRWLRSNGLADDPPFLRLFALAFVVGAGFVIGAYGGPVFWPVLIGGFGASLGAFVLALSWDHEKERRERAAAEQGRKDDWERERQYVQEQLVTEARRRLEPIREELRRDAESLRALKEAFDMQAPLPDLILSPELLDFAWAANGPRLSQILADVDLVSKLATTYGRMEELRWRLRQRTSYMGFNPSMAHAIAMMTEPLVVELATEVDDLRTRVDQQAEKPDVQELGVLVTGAASLAVHLQLSASGTVQSGSASGTDVEDAAS